LQITRNSLQKTSKMLYLFGDDVLAPTSRFGSPHRHHFHHNRPCHNSPRRVPRGWNQLINWEDAAQEQYGDKLGHDLERDIGEVFKALGFEVVPEKKPKTDPTKVEGEEAQKSDETKETLAVEQAQKEGQQVATSKDMFRLNILMGKAFKPEDIKVSLKDRKLTVEAKREQTSEDGTHRYYEEVSRSFTLPEEAELKELKSVFTPNGVLKLEAPVTPKALPEPPKPVQIPISMEE